MIFPVSVTVYQRPQRPRLPPLRYVTVALFCSPDLAIGGEAVREASTDVTGPQVTSPKVTGPKVTSPEVTSAKVTGPKVTSPKVTTMTSPKDDDKPSGPLLPCKV